MNSIVRLAFVALAALSTAATGLTQQPSPSDPPGALPYDLAFGMASFIWDTQFAVSADGRFVAYDVRVPPADATANLDKRYQPNGTPSSVVGATIRYTEMATKRTVEVCPGGTCWRPAWSPDGASLAFFSDADGDLFGTYGRIDVDGGGFFLAWSEGGQARMGTHPWADVRRYLDNSPYYNADKISTPVLIVHGTEDMAYHDAGKLFSALRRLGKPAQLASYLDQGHVISSWRRSSATDAARRMVEFYRRHLGDPTRNPMIP